MATRSCILISDTHGRYILAGVEPPEPSTDDALAVIHPSSVSRFLPLPILPRPDSSNTQLTRILEGSSTYWLMRSTSTVLRSKSSKNGKAARPS